MRCTSHHRPNNNLCAKSGLDTYSSAVPVPLDDKGNLHAHDNCDETLRRKSNDFEFNSGFCAGRNSELSMADNKKSPFPSDADARVWPDAAYLRQQARRCVSLSRACPHEATARALETLGVDLLEKAVELELLQEQLKLWRPPAN